MYDQLQAEDPVYLIYLYTPLALINRRIWTLPASMYEYIVSTKHVPR